MDLETLATGAVIFSGLYQAATMHRNPVVLPFGLMAAIGTAGGLDTSAYMGTFTGIFSAAMAVQGNVVGSKYINIGMGIVLAAGSGILIASQ